MNMHNLPAQQRRIREVVEEYEKKAAAIDQAIEDFKGAMRALEMAANIGGSFGGSVWSGGYYGSAPTINAKTVEQVLRVSAWKNIYEGLNIKEIASAKDRKQFEMSLENPPEFTRDNVAATFGDYVMNHRHHILKGLAECFCDLDPAYKSHSKVKIGVEGLPKRIIVQSVGSYGSWGYDRVKDTLNALNIYRGNPHIDHKDYSELLDDAEEHGGGWYDGVEIRRFMNGNAHLIFDPETQRDINLALAEFYGDTLPDSPEEASRQRPGTAVSKNLAYYPTPTAVVARVLAQLDLSGSPKVLEPSCGCGRLMEGVRAKNPNAIITGVEYDAGRTEEARAKGFRVHHGNFLDTAAQPVFDFVVMNPPFNGREWRRHLNHARQFLKKPPEGKRWGGGVLACILPASALYDGHLADLGLTSSRDHGWYDLPVASFAESGTNIPTGIVILGPE